MRNRRLYACDDDDVALSLRGATVGTKLEHEWIIASVSVMSNWKRAMAVERVEKLAKAPQSEHAKRQGQF